MRLQNFLRALLQAILGPPKPVPTPTPPTPKPPVPTNDAEALLVSHNKERNASGVWPLSLNAKLTAAAQKHAVWMASHNRLDHSQNGVAFSVRITAEGYRFWTAGENIAMGQNSVQSVTQSWMNSPGHRANILNGSYKDVGFGVAESNGRKYWCADFASQSQNAMHELEPGVFLSGPLGPEREEVNHLT